ncbi:hypothetical protein BV898_12095 [Hypsibius exemplaris]|uniref:G-protein coupled receptors family 1 profile domain-containing protein n=1 Tax=Hypsibius exemplaris TaxID=2072580 RepID=A0A1W0WES1_HYPEX|nr:hypothetical protein BV898_12095 [Hypsibius exemplaris]
MNLSTNITATLPPFPALPRSKRQELTAWLAVTLTISFFGVANNLLLLRITLPTKVRKFGVGPLVVHFVVLNLLMCLVSFPSILFVVLAKRDGWPIAGSACYYVHTIFTINVSMVNWSDAGLAVNRFVALYYPHRYRTCTSTPVNLAVILLSWIICVGFTVPFAVAVNAPGVAMSPLGLCTFSNSISRNYLAFTISYVPYAVSGVASLLILWKFVGHHLRLQRGTVAPDATATCRTATRRLNMARMILVTFLWSGICALPTYIIGTLLPSLGRNDPVAALWIRTGLVCQYTFTPCIMLISNGEYRRRVTRIFKGHLNLPVSVAAVPPTGTRDQWTTGGPSNNFELSAALSRSQRNSNDVGDIPWRISLANMSFSFNVTLAQTPFPILSQRKQQELTAWLATTLTISFIGVANNLLLLRIIWPAKIRKLGVGLLIVHFVVLNLLMCLVTFPVEFFIVLAKRDGWPIAGTACYYVQTMYTINASVVNWSDTGLAVNRVVALYYPHRYRTWSTMPRGVAMIVCSWMICIGVTVLTIATGDGPTVSISVLGQCSFSNKIHLGLVLTAFIAYVPFAICGVASLLILWKFLLQYRSTFRTAAIAPNGNARHRTARRSLNMARMLLLTFLWCGICVLPAYVVRIRFPSLSRTDPVSVQWMRTALVCQYAVTPHGSRPPSPSASSASPTTSSSFESRGLPKFSNSALSVVNWFDAGLAVNRVVALYYPHRYRAWTTTPLTVGMVVCSWLICIGFIVPIVAAVSDGFTFSMSASGQCSFSRAIYLGSVLTSLGPYVPFAICGTACLLILWNFITHQHLSLQGLAVGGTTAGSARRRTAQRSLNLARMLLVTFLWCGICVAPSYVISAVFPALLLTDPVLGRWMRTAH